MIRCGLGLLACHTALIVARARQSVDIGDLVDMLKWDLDFMADQCPDMGRAMRIINSQLGGEEDTSNPGLVMVRLTEFRKVFRTALLSRRQKKLDP
jgi:hypothetical protein